MTIVSRDKTKPIPKADPEYIAKKGKIVKRNKAQGRSIQSKIAKRLGGKSVGTIEGQDVAFYDKPWSIEVKHRKKFVGNAFMAQAIKNAPKDKTPIVIVHELNQRFNNSLVMIRLKDWELWYGRLDNEIA